MTQPERRKDQQKSPRELRGELNEAQRDTRAELERYGWQLKFIRRPIFQPSIPVVFDGDRKTFAILEPDGTLNEKPMFDIRHD